jgi:hypothetical protein
MIPPSPGGVNSRRPTIVRRSASAAGYDYHQPARDQLKRSFWHHAKPGDYYSTPMHPEFLPPKRPKIGCAPKVDVVLTPRTPMDEAMEAEHRGYPRHDNWFNRTLPWSAQDGETDYNRMVHRSHSFPAQWGPPPQPPQATPSPPGRDRGWFDGGRALPSPTGASDRPSPHGPPVYSPANRQYSNQWHSDFRPPAYPRHGPPSPSPHHQSRGMVPTWNNQPTQGMHYRDDDEAHANASWYSARDAESSHREGMDARRQVTFDSERQKSEAPYSPSSFQSRTKQQQQPSEPITQGNTIITEEGTKIRLLALPEDRISLSETLCVVREVSHNH